jgi:hypothetical protein
VNYAVDDAFSTQLLGSMNTMFQMMTSAEFVQALAAKVSMDKPPQTITKRLMGIPGFTVKGFANLVGSDVKDL